MSITRTSTTYHLLQTNLSRTSTRLNALYLQTSTGTAVSKPSDDPSAVAAILSCRTDIVKGERYVENCKHVQESLANAESVLDAVEELMTRAKEIAVTGANDSLSAADRTTLADEVGQLRQSLLDLANSQVGGRYLFGGYADQSEPFSGSPVTYNGTSDQQRIEVSPGETVGKNLPGDTLFMTPNNLFTTLEDLQTALSSGSSTDVSSQLTPLESAADQIRSAQSTLGNTSTRLDDLISLQENTLLLTRSALSSHQDADLTQVLSAISQTELALQATMEVTSRVGMLTLLDYL